MNDFRNRMANWMRGRNGMDSYSVFLSWAALICIFLSWIPHLALLDLVGLILLIYSYFRIFSRNVAKRSEENRRHLLRMQKVRDWWWSFRNRMRSLWSNVRQSPEYHIYKCPGCGQKIRIPRGKGRIMVRCPKCGREFQKHS